VPDIIVHKIADLLAEQAVRPGSQVNQTQSLPQFSDK
jgi:hypothetical protein